MSFESAPAPRTLGELRAAGLVAAQRARGAAREPAARASAPASRSSTGILGYDDTRRARGRERDPVRPRPDLPRRARPGEDAHDPPARRRCSTSGCRSSPAARSTTIRSRRSRRYARALVAEQGDATPIAWVHRDDRYVEKLATPDVSIADLIGDVDPVKVAEGRSLADELTIHFGLMPRTNRGIFCINELPDLTEKVQVGLFNVMEERDVQVKGYRVRLPLDVLVVASANPEDYTSRGRIITPLKDRYEAQIRTHYPPTRELEIAVVQQEAQAAAQRRRRRCTCRASWRRSSAEITLQARQSADVSQARASRCACRSRTTRRSPRTRCGARCASARARRCRASPISPRSRSRPAASSSSSTRAQERTPAEVVERAGEARDPRGLRRAAADRGHRERGRGVRAGLEGRGLGDDAVGRVPRRASTRSPACAKPPPRWPAATPRRGSRPRSSSCSRACTSRTGSTRTSPTTARPLRATLIDEALRYSRWDGTQRPFSLDAEQRSTRSRIC